MIPFAAENISILVVDDVADNLYILSTTLSDLILRIF